MRKNTALKIKVTVLALAIAASMTSVSAFAAESYELEFGSLYSGPNTVVHPTFINGGSASNYVSQTSSAYPTTYYIVSGSTNVAGPRILSGSQRVNFPFTEIVNRPYNLKGVAPSVGGRPGYTAKGTWQV